MLPHISYLPKKRLSLFLVNKGGWLDSHKRVLVDPQWGSSQATLFCFIYLKVHMEKTKNIWWDTFPLFLAILILIFVVLLPSILTIALGLLALCHLWLFRFANKEGFWQSYVFLGFPPYAIYYAISKYKQLKPLVIAYFTLMIICGIFVLLYLPSHS